MNIKIRTKKFKINYMFILNTDAINLKSYFFEKEFKL